MAISDEILEFFKSVSTPEIKGHNSFYDVRFVIAERKAFLSKQKLEYQAKYKIDDANKVVEFTEMLKEVKSGFSVGDDISGAGFKSEKYSIGDKKREGTISEQSNIFGKKYQYEFDFKTIRTKIEEIVKKSGYQFKYNMT